MAKIGITMGDCAGIGPEIILKSLKSNEMAESKNEYVIYGDKGVFRQINELTNICPGGIDHLNFVDLALINEPVKFGTVDENYGRAAGEYIKKAIEDAMEKKIASIVTGPIHKKAFQLGGFGEKYPGHTEMLADLTGTKDYTMMLAYKNLRVIHATIHVPLKKAIEMITTDTVFKAIKIGYETCRRMNISDIKIGVAGLNPHAGDYGLFGHEDKEEIEPAVEMASKEFDCAIEGPVPPDTIFCKALGGMYDMVIAMYHDQGHIPIKALGFLYNHDKECWTELRGVNVTLGLPFIRSAVDHGTAFGKAGKGTACSESMIEAIQYAEMFSN